MLPGMVCACVLLLWLDTVGCRNGQNRLALMALHHSLDSDVRAERLFFGSNSKVLEILKDASRVLALDNARLDSNLRISLRCPPFPELLEKFYAIFNTVDEQSFELSGIHLWLLSGDNIRSLRSIDRRMRHSRYFIVDHPVLTLVNLASMSLQMQRHTTCARYTDLALKIFYVNRSTTKLDQGMLVDMDTVGKHTNSHNPAYPSEVERYALRTHVTWMKLVLCMLGYNFALCATELREFSVAIELCDLLIDVLTSVHTATKSDTARKFRKSIISLRDLVDHLRRNLSSAHVHADRSFGGGGYAGSIQNSQAPAPWEASSVKPVGSSGVSYSPIASDNLNSFDWSDHKTEESVDGKKADVESVATNSIIGAPKTQFSPWFTWSHAGSTGVLDAFSSVDLHPQLNSRHHDCAIALVFDMVRCRNAEAELDETVWTTSKGSSSPEQIRSQARQSVAGLESEKDASSFREIEKILRVKPKTANTTVNTKRKSKSRKSTGLRKSKKRSSPKLPGLSRTSDQTQSRTLLESTSASISKRAPAGRGIAPPKAVNSQKNHNVPGLRISFGTVCENVASENQLYHVFRRESFVKKYEDILKTILNIPRNAPLATSSARPHSEISSDELSIAQDKRPHTAVSRFSGHLSRIERVRMSQVKISRFMRRMLNRFKYLRMRRGMIQLQRRFRNRRRAKVENYFTCEEARTDLSFRPTGILISEEPEPLDDPEEAESSERVATYVGTEHEVKPVVLDDSIMLIRPCLDHPQRPINIRRQECMHTIESTLNIQQWDDEGNCVFSETYDLNELFEQGYRSVKYEALKLAMAVYRDEYLSAKVSAVRFISLWKGQCRVTSVFLTIP